MTSLPFTIIYLEDTVLDVELRYPELVHEGRHHREGGARLGHDGDGHGSAHAVLALLNLAVHSHRQAIYTYTRGGEGEDN